jgi:hypothetical protein
MRLSQLFFCLVLLAVSAVPSLVTAGTASAAENQSTPPPDGQGGGHECEHEKKEKEVS